MNFEKEITAIFSSSFTLAQQTARELWQVVAAASKLMAASLVRGGKLLSCGNGGSASDAMHFTAEIANRFLRERDGLAAIALSSNVSLLTAIANDYGYQYIFSRQIKALGNDGDVLLAISTSGNSENIILAIEQAQLGNMPVVFLSGNGGGKAANLLGEKDVNICVHSDCTPRIQEMHILIIHCLCELVDKILSEEGYL